MSSGGEQEPAVRAIVAGHGTFASGIVSAVEQITGRGQQFIAVSNTGLCLDDIQGALASALDVSHARVIFTDLPAGSCTMAVRRMIRERPGVLLVTGINLSLLLDFVMQDDTDPVVAVQAALERGRASMVVYGA
ncbi:PTS sugar transporter subunit IIA [Gemmatimonas sp.]|uniref:PTS sugar transporter subunit IIA n=1 Tax=Gemmatimonas sp. TaxID=1962908 RepID=UPI003F7154E1